jgi:hypothetical protein
MNILVIRRAVWAATVVAATYAVVAFWYWRPTEMLLAAGAVALGIVTSLILTCELRARQSSPFGPVQKWGRPPVAQRVAHRQARAVTVIRGGRKAPWHVRARLLWRKLTPWWTLPLMLVGVLAMIALLVPAPAGASTGQQGALTTGEFAVVLVIEIVAVGLAAVFVTVGLLRLLDRWSDR